MVESEVFAGGLVLWSVLLQRRGGLNNLCFRAGMEIQFLCTIRYSSAAAFACGMKPGEIPASLAAVKALPSISVTAKFSLLDFCGLCYGYMKYRIITLSCFDKCYTDKEIFVISGGFSVVCMKVKQSLLSYILGASLSSLLRYISTYLFSFVLNSYLSLSLLQDAIKFF